MNVLLIGSGGREHAFAWKIAQSPRLTKLYVAPGNAGIGEVAINVALDPLDFGALKEFVLSNGVHLVIVGPEAPLVAGITDFFKTDASLRYIPVVGPGAEGAQLEGSKDFSKTFMMRHGIPTAQYHTFTADTLEQGLRFLETLDAPYVLKADGLAAGKGVLICDELVEAQVELTAMLLDAKFGDASKKVVIEEFLRGIELSVFVLTDGVSSCILPAAKDYKRIGEGDTGLNTGGMGAVSPVPFANADFMRKVEERVVKPTITGLAKDGIDYAGFIFIGLMNVNGNPFVIEYNVRMGDPETEVVIPRIKSDLLELFEAVGNRELSTCRLEVDERTACTVMLVADGYPGNYRKGDVITGLDKVEGSQVFHAGTTVNDGRVVTSGGRVLTITSLCETLSGALALSFANANKVNYQGKYYRTDIGADLLELEAAR
jgi:phosphoribosylamine---glycine ligase